MRSKIVQIAQNEVGYKESGNNQTKYGEWYGMQDEWCNIFVSWCANQAGISEDIIPKMAYVPSTANWYDAKGQYKNSKAFGGNYIPLAGDIVLFDYNRNTDSDHIGIVEKVEGNKLYTIEGNKDNMVKREIYSLDSKDIRAYCVPAYEKKGDNIEDEGNVESEGFEVKKYKNGSTKEIVYQTTECQEEIGYLNPYEECDCYGITNGLAIVCYKIDGSTIGEKKVGFVKWLDGVM